MQDSKNSAQAQVSHSDLTSVPPAGNAAHDTATFLIAAFYHFQTIPQEKLKELVVKLNDCASKNGTRGLIILATEGMNGTCAGSESGLRNFLLEAAKILDFPPLSFKESHADIWPFREFKVRLRSEIVTLGKPEVQPHAPKSHTHLSPEEWDNMMEQEDVVVVDTRNTYETRIGKFQGAIDPEIREFTQFSKFMETSQIDKDKKVLIYCTGGIRCEKATVDLENLGYKNVYQLDGGILNYFKQRPHAKFEGECFVFDARVAVDQEMKPSSLYKLCAHCGQPADVVINCVRCGVETSICPDCAPIDSKNTCSKNCAHHWSRSPGKTGIGQGYSYHKPGKGRRKSTAIVNALILCLAVGTSVVACSSQSSRNQNLGEETPITTSPLTTTQSALEPTLMRFDLKNPPTLNTTGEGQNLFLGGFSGLIFEGRDSRTGELKFLTHTDRGPNAAPPKDVKSDRLKARLLIPFVVPNYQLEWVHLALNVTTGVLEVRDRTPLRNSNDTPITGLPNHPGPKGQGLIDETPVDMSGNELPPDPMGLDPESIAKDADGTYWMGEEYRPSIVHFSHDGKVIERYVPHGAGFGKEVLPAEFAYRRLNRGFEGLAIRKNKIYAFLQSGLYMSQEKPVAPYPDATRVVEFDPRTKQVTGEYFFLLDDQINDKKLGDVTALPNGDFLMIEQTGAMGAKADKKIYRLALGNATNLLNLKGAHGNHIRQNLEHMSAQERIQTGLQPLQKQLVVDVSKLGFNYAGKAEGLTVVDDETIAIASDNDFQLDEPQNSTITLVKVPNAGFLKSKAANHSPLKESGLKGHR
jgi:UPF0176 protein